MIDSSRGVILDYTEEKPIKLCAESIEMFRGPLLTNTKVVVILEMISK